MRELEYILKLRRDIDSVELRLEELKSLVYPGSQIISDMPRGGGYKNKLEEYIVKWDKLKGKKHRLEMEILRRWAAMEERFRECNVTEAQRDVMKYRFFYGRTWKKCVYHMRAEYPEAMWNEQKLFRIYRKVLEKTDM